MNQIGSRQNHILKYIFGYILGIGIFIILIPYIIWHLSSMDNQIFRTPIVPVDTANIIIAAPIFVIGVIFLVWSNIFLVLKGRGGPTNIGKLSVSPKTKILVREGPYKYTRNPMAFGANSIYLSITIYFNSLGSLIVLVLFFFVVVRYVLVAEDKRLLRDFGADYLHYKQRTSMIIPLPLRKTEKG